MNRTLCLLAAALWAATSNATLAAEPFARTGDPVVGSFSVVAPPTEISGTSDRTRRAPAPGLSYVRVVAVASQQYAAWDPVPLGATATTRDHGGTWIAVAVYERGYGSNSPVIRLSGTLVRPNAFLPADPVCAEVGLTLYSCRPGQSIIGWVKYFQLPASQGGTFSYSNSSLSGTFPIGTRSTSLFIR